MRLRGCPLLKGNYDLVGRREPFVPSVAVAPPGRSHVDTPRSSCWMSALGTIGSCQGLVGGGGGGHGFTNTRGPTRPFGNPQNV